MVMTVECRPIPKPNIPKPPKYQTNNIETVPPAGRDGGGGMVRIGMFIEML